MYRTLLFCLAFTGLWASAQAQQNSEEAQAKPYVILISCDGYRWDYTARFQPPNITRRLASGVQAFSMIPSFPSKTFPNHYAIATGLIPERNGLVANTFYDPERQEEYYISKRSAVEDGTWYEGTPLWVNAEQNGMVSASFFFVGSEADIQGVRPSYFFPYKGATPNEERVDQVLQWLRLPEGQRPHLITMYFSDMDDAGHRYGPSNDEVIGKSLLKLDADLGRLFDGVDATGLPVNIVMVSDHGMVDVAPDKLINIDPLKDDSLFRVANNGAMAIVYLEPGADPAATEAFLNEKAAGLPLEVYALEDFPHYHSKSDPRLGDFILYPEYGFYLSDSRRIGLVQSGRFKQGGEHGFDPEYPDMHAIFYAFGPAFKPGLAIPSFRNVHVYPLICQLLGLPVPAGIDGRAEVLQGILQAN
ncbi:alkaline phosphatase family protein [Phaeodactylibacter luteus]|uniref:Alkaline phosphatase family protein n=1 Tax=Phaeodactylibacter luteus TaxID=1564516 RepID=A0A5C6S1P2_9BACT|nr:ectonucleotide pyrophosphatase/phosphodiesterase [Phaeodactylibacter luteus]TXB68303.1 alkaline phosphatase family protein [Phaeodactylibacter luteus]